MADFVYCKLVFYKVSSMRWKKSRRSDNIEDRRGARVVKRAGGGGLGIIVIALIAMFFGVDPRMILQMAGDMQQGQGASTRTSNPVQQTAAEQELANFVSVVLADTEDTWHPIFRQLGGQYKEPKLVLFSDSVHSACGMASAAMGPFYCPADQKVYIDLSFYAQLRQQYNAPGDFAQAYVIAHEVGHHVQTLLGISQQVHQQKRSLNKAQANALSVRQELQADCFSGVWANHADRARQVLESGDVEEALRAATAIGDDNLQRRSQGYVVPESFTHGTSAQRVRWFKIGLQYGDIKRCDTYSARSL